MALSGTFYKSISSSWRLQGEWTATQSITGNYSDVVLKVYWMGLDDTSAIYQYTNNLGYVEILGNRSNFSETARLTANQKKLLHYHTVRVFHDSDGSKSVKLEVAFNLEGINLRGTFYNFISATTIVDLNNIPRSSTLSSGQSWTVGSPTTFHIARASSDFKHDIKIEVSNGSTYQDMGTLFNINTSHTWVPDADKNNILFDFVNNNTSLWLQFSRITVTTKDGLGNIVGVPQVITGVVTSPLASTTSSNSWFNVGDSVPITITRAHSNFVHIVKFYVGSLLVHSSPLGQTTSYTWVPTEQEKLSMYNAMVNSITTESKVAIDTYNVGGIYQKVRNTVEYTGVATVVNSNPTAPVVIYDDTNIATATVTGNNQYIVQNKSTLRVRVLSANKATGVNSATIVKYIATVNGVSITDPEPFETDIVFNFGTMDTNTNQELKVTAYDSRGLSSETMLTVNIVPWRAPTLNAVVLRDGGFLDTVSVKIKGTISPVEVLGAYKNALVPSLVTYEYRAKGGLYGSKVSFLGQVVTMPEGTYSSTDVSLFLSNTSAWDVLVTVTDRFGSISKTLSVGIGVPIMFVDATLKSVGIGKFPTRSSALDVSGDIFMTGELVKTKYKHPNGYNELGVRDGGTPNNDTYIIQNINVLCEMGGAAQAFIDVIFPTNFSDSPLWVIAQPVNSLSVNYNAAVYTPTATGCRVYLNQIHNAVYTGTIAINVVACGKKVSQFA